MFWNSMAPFEQQHIIDAFRFELGKCMNKNTHQHLVDLLGHINTQLARAVGEGLGVVPAKATPAKPRPAASPALSMADAICSPKTRKVAILVAPGCDKQQLDAMAQALSAAGTQYEVVSFRLGPVATKNSGTVEAGQTFATTAAALYDAVYVPGGAHAAALEQSDCAMEFVAEAYRQYKAIALGSAAAGLLPLKNQKMPQGDRLAGVTIGETPQQTEEFLAALPQRHYQRCGAPPAHS
jgi:catalase